MESIKSKSSYSVPKSTPIKVLSLPRQSSSTHSIVKNVPSKQKHRKASYKTSSKHGAGDGRESKLNYSLTEVYVDLRRKRQAICRILRDRLSTSDSELVEKLEEANTLALDAAQHVGILRTQLREIQKILEKEEVNKGKVSKPFGDNLPYLLNYTSNHGVMIADKFVKKQRKPKEGQQIPQKNTSSILIAELKRKDLQVRNLEKENKELHQRVQTLAENVDDLESVVKTLRHQFEAEEHAGDLAEAKGSDKDMYKLKSSSARPSEVSAELLMWKHQIEDYQKQNKKLKELLNEKTNSLETLQLEYSHHHTNEEASFEAFKTNLQERLRNLEPLPEILRNTELRLEAALCERSIAEKRNEELETEVKKMKAEVKMLEQNATKASSVKTFTYEERCMELEKTNIALHAEVSHQSKRIEDKIRENASLSGQLEQALESKKLELERAHERYNAQGRNLKTRIDDLERQIQRLRSEKNHVTTAKDEMHIKFEKRIAELSSLLQQSQLQNRELQAYVNMLKTSYTDMFGARTDTDKTGSS